MLNESLLLLTNETIREILTPYGNCVYIDINTKAIKQISFYICILSFLFLYYLIIYLVKNNKVENNFFVYSIYSFLIFLLSSYLIYGVTYNYRLFIFIHSISILTILFLFLGGLLKHEKTKRFFDNSKK